MAVRQRDGGYRLLWPEFGGVSVVVALPLVYLLVRIGTPRLVEQLAPLYPTVFPEPFTTVVAALLWAGAAVVVLYFVRADALLTIEWFEEREALEAHVQDGQQGRRWYVLAVGRFVVGTALLAVSGESFVPAFERLLDLAVVDTAAFDPAFGPLDAVWLGAFFVGFVLFARGVDQLVVAGTREYVRRRYCE